jgi:hypothetical protein
MYGPLKGVIPSEASDLQSRNDATEKSQGGALAASQLTAASRGGPPPDATRLALTESVASGCSEARGWSLRCWRLPSLVVLSHGERLYRVCLARANASSSIFTRASRS